MSPRFRPHTLLPWFALLTMGANKTCTFSLSGEGAVSEQSPSTSPSTPPPTTTPPECGAGNICYAGTRTGRIYISPSLQPSEQGGARYAATSLDAPGAFSLKAADTNGLSPGTPVPLYAWMDTLNTGRYEPVADPVASATGTVQADGSVTGAAFVLQDPAGSPADQQPVVSALQVLPFDGGAFVFFEPIANEQGEELVDHYVVRADPGGGGTTTDHVVRAGVPQVAVFTNLVSGSAYTFAVAGRVGDAEYPWQSSGPATIGALPPIEGGHAVHGTVDPGDLTFSAPLTSAEAAFVVLYNEDESVRTAAVVSASSLQEGSPVTFAITDVPDGTYMAGLVVDRDGDGELGPTDFMGLDDGQGQLVTVSGDDVTLDPFFVPPGDVQVTAMASQLRLYDATPASLNGSSFDSWAVSLRVSSNHAQAVRAQAVSGLGISAPFDMDLAESFRLQWWTMVTLPSAPAAPGEPLSSSYEVSYAQDSTLPGQPASATVQTATAALQGSLPDFVSDIQVTEGSEPGHPVFSWSAPANPEMAELTFFVAVSELPPDQMWSPSGLQFLWGTSLPSTATSIEYGAGVDGPPPAALTPGTEYRLHIMVMDQLGNMSEVGWFFLAP